MGKRLLIDGARSQGKINLDCAINMMCYDEIVFLSDDKNILEVHSYPVINESNITVEEIKKHFDEVIVAYGNNYQRYKKSMFYSNHGVKLATLIHPSAQISDFSVIKPGTIICANAVVNIDAKIGEACIINTGSIVEHDCVVADGVQLSPMAVIAGNVCVGKRTWLCLGSKVSNNVSIGKDSVIASGAVVLNNVADKVLVAGVPARIKKYY